MRTDPSGRYVAIFRRWHLIGLEVGISVASAALRAEATGAATCFNADVIATAKRNLKPGEMLDGEGGYTVFGKLFPASKSLRLGELAAWARHDEAGPPSRQGSVPHLADVAMDESLPAYKIRKEMERLFAKTDVVAAK